MEGHRHQASGTGGELLISWDRAPSCDPSASITSVSERGSEGKEQEGSGEGSTMLGVEVCHLARVHEHSGPLALAASSVTMAEGCPTSPKNLGGDHADRPPKATQAEGAQ